MVSVLFTTSKSMIVIVGLQSLIVQQCLTLSEFAAIHTNIVSITLNLLLREPQSAHELISHYQALKF